MIRTVIVDDEPLARQGLHARLEGHADVEIIGEAHDGPHAVETILRARPDLVFLDIQMPGCDGFEVVEQVADTYLPIFIFVTAYDQYALRAFDAHALDYLLKPYGVDRFEAALDRARREISRDEQLERHQRLVDLLDGRATGEDSRDTPSEGTAYRRRFTVKEHDRYVLIRTGDIDWIESAANYVRIHARGASYMLRATMTDLERQLDPVQFARIHRTTIVNVDRVKEINPEWHGDFDVVLRDGTTLRLSRSYRDRLLR